MQFAILIVLAIFLDAAVLVGLQVMMSAPPARPGMARISVIAFGLAILNTAIFAAGQVWLAEWGVPLAITAALIVDGWGLHALARFSRRQVMLALGTLTCFWIARAFAGAFLLSS